MVAAPTIENDIDITTKTLTQTMVSSKFTKIGQEENRDFDDRHGFSMSPEYKPYKHTFWHNIVNLLAEDTKERYGKCTRGKN
jgi:hypothetical protein